MLDPLTKGYLTLRPDDAARSLLRLEPIERKALFAAMSRPVAARVLEKMASASASQCLADLDNKIGSEILEQLPVTASVAVLRPMKPALLKTLLGNMPRSLAVRIRLRLRFSESAIGAYADVNVVTLQPEQHVADALRLYRKDGRSTGQTVYVLDEYGQLVGEVHLSDLLGARDRTFVKRIMRPVAAALSARSSFQSVSNHTAWLTHDSLPVINRNNVYQGVLRRDKVIEKHEQLINRVTEHNELLTTRAALADIFWMAAGALLAAGGATRRSSEGD